MDSYEENQQPYLSGRHIGKTNVNLNEYLGKKAYINGSFSMGQPTLLTEKNITDFLVREEKVILKIDSLILTE